MILFYKTIWIRQALKYFRCNGSIEIHNRSIPSTNWILDPDVKKRIMHKRTYIFVCAVIKR